MTVPEVETDRLLLRGFRDEDGEAWAEICADEETMSWLAREPMDRGDAWRHMAELAGHWQLKGYGQWAMEERDGGELVGRAGLYFPADWPGLEVGWLVRRDRWGRGYATEAGAAAVRFAFEQVGADHVLSLIAPENVASRRVAEKLGARPAGSVELRGHTLEVLRIDRPGGG